MYLVADINVDICAATSCKLCTQYCPEANTILYSDNLGKEKGLKYGSAYVAVDRCKGCAQCVWVCDNMAKHHAITMTMIDQLRTAAITARITSLGSRHRLRASRSGGHCDCRDRPADAHQAERHDLPRSHGPVGVERACGRKGDGGAGNRGPDSQRADHSDAGLPAEVPEGRSGGGHQSEPSEPDDLGQQDRGVYFRRRALSLCKPHPEDDPCRYELLHRGALRGAGP